MKQSYDISSLDKLSSVASELLSYSDNRIFVLHGDLGVGKTTLVRYMCYHLKVVDSISSPTFSIVNEYLNTQNEKLFHFDFYRIKNLDDVIKLGLDVYINSGAYCFVEWPQLIMPLLNMNHHEIKIIEYPKKRELILIK